MLGMRSLRTPLLLSSSLLRVWPSAPVSAISAPVCTTTFPYFATRTSAAKFGTRSLRMASTIPRLPVFEALQKHDPESTAVIHSVSGRSFKYGELLGDVCRTRNRLLEAAGKSDIGGERVAFLVENSYDYVGKRHIEYPGGSAWRTIATPRPIANALVQ